MRELKTSFLSEKEELIKQFAKYTAGLHEQQILHLDYSSGNILYKKDGDDYIFYLVDLNRMEFDKPITMDTACFNFRRLWGSDDMIFLFIKEYAQNRNFDVEDCLKRTLYYRKRFWDNFTKKHPGSSPYITSY
jgi:Phosphotransferase enzyme family.